MECQVPTFSSRSILLNLLSNLLTLVWKASFTITQDKWEFPNSFLTQCLERLWGKMTSNKWKKMWQLKGAKVLARNCLNFTQSWKLYDIIPRKQIEGASSMLEIWSRGPKFRLMAIEVYKYGYLLSSLSQCLTGSKESFQSPLYIFIP